MPRSYPIKSRITFSDTIPPFPGLFRWSYLLISVLCSLQISFFFRKSPFHIFGSIPVTMPSMRVPALHSKFYCQVFPQIDQVRWILKKWNKAKYLIQSREYIWHSVLYALLTPTNRFGLYVRAFGFNGGNVWNWLLLNWPTLPNRFCNSVN